MTIKEVCDSLIAIEEILSIKTNPSEIKLWLPSTVMS